MNIIQVNNCDVMGRRFNGYDLHLSLNALGHKAYQLVWQKSGNEPTAISLDPGSRFPLRSILKNLEFQLGMNNLLNPLGRHLREHSLFQNADIVHYHLIHNQLLSIVDLPMLTSLKPSVWTVHDPWLVTGHCVHPLGCMGWKDGCVNCPRLDDAAFPMQVDKASQMWSIKKQVYQELDMDIVVASRFMEDVIRSSPLTAHFKRVHRIPFGIQAEDFCQVDSGAARERLGIPFGDFVIAFRSETNELKGLKYVLEMLDRLAPTGPVTLLTVGFGLLPGHLADKYHVVELGWQDDFHNLCDFYAASDVFLMPSLAESFGLMAIEAMASGTPIIVFEGTVLPEITFAPECGLAVPYQDSALLAAAVERLMRNPEERRRRGEKGKELAQKHYRYKDYVAKHISLYEEILQRRTIIQSKG